MEFTIMSGFLGSGKTVTLKNLITQLGDEAANNTALIINDFGEIGIDASVLGSTGMKPVELLSGCVCCQLGEDLRQTLTDLYQAYSPARVILEPSGIAQPSAIKDTLTALQEIPIDIIRNIVLVDPVRFDSLLKFVAPVIKDGIVSADLVVITKADLVDEEQLQKVKTKLSELNDQVEIIVISNLEPETLLPLREVVIGEQ